jgi:hypothetical protein
MRIGEGPIRSVRISRKIMTIKTNLKDALNKGRHQ